MSGLKWGKVRAIINDIGKNVNDAEFVDIANSFHRDIEASIDMNRLFYNYHFLFWFLD